MEWGNSGLTEVDFEKQGSRVEYNAAAFATQPEAVSYVVDGSANADRLTVGRLRLGDTVVGWHSVGLVAGLKHVQCLLAVFPG